MKNKNKVFLDCYCEMLVTGLCTLACSHGNAAGIMPPTVHPGEKALCMDLVANRQKYLERFFWREVSAIAHGSSSCSVRQGTSIMMVVSRVPIKN